MREEGENVMADFVSGIKNITPTYPVRPTQPAQKDREPGGQRKKRRDSGTDEYNPDGHDHNDKPTIDEHV